MGTSALSEDQAYTKARAEGGKYRDKAVYRRTTFRHRRKRLHDSHLFDRNLRLGLFHHFVILYRVHGNRILARGGLIGPVKQDIILLIASFLSSRDLSV